MHSSNERKQSFLTDYAIALAACAGNDHQDNYNSRRFGPQNLSTTKPSLRQKLATKRQSSLKRKGFLPVKDVDLLLWSGLSFVEPHITNLQWLYEHLKDAESRYLLLQVICFRAIGYTRVKLPQNQPSHWKLLEAVERMAEGRETIDPNFLGWKLTKLDLREFGYPVELFYRPDVAVIHFLYEQYRCQSPHEIIEAEDGDVVVDAGGCWADSALYFAHKTRGRGKVYSFEFLPDNLKIYDRNLKLNPDLAKSIEILPHPVWSTSDVELFIHQNGPGSTVTPTRSSEGDSTVRTMTIDQLMDRPDFSRIDFIKMDIEGAELPALHGSERVLRTFRPKLAITVYHSLADFWEIPQYLEQLGLGYRFYLRHFTIHSEETVLFAICDKQ